MGNFGQFQGLFQRCFLGVSEAFRSMSRQSFRIGWVAFEGLGVVGDDIGRRGCSLG